MVAGEDIGREGLSYDDVLLVPERGVLDTRADADISANFVLGLKIEIPIISAPMSSVTEAHMANAMWTNGGFGVLHRFADIPDTVAMYRQAQTAIGLPGTHHFNGRAKVAVAIGINEEFTRADALFDEGCTDFVLDVAHAHSDRVIKFVKEFRKIYADDAVLIVGNIATKNAAYDLIDAGADGLKVGIGPGAACSTRIVTGFGVPQLTAIFDVRSVIDSENEHVTLIADGGIKNSGDCVKALAAGADTIMIGRLLAGADEAPHPGDYFGMASKRVNGDHAPEGVEGKVERTGPVADTIKSLAWGIRSGVSYAGATNLEELQRYATFMRVTPMSAAESGVRI